MQPDFGTLLARHQSALARRPIPLYDFRVLEVLNLLSNISSGELVLELFWGEFSLGRSLEVVSQLSKRDQVTAQGSGCRFRWWAVCTSSDGCVDSTARGVTHDDDLDGARGQDTWSERSSLPCMRHILTHCLRFPKPQQQRRGPHWNCRPAHSTDLLRS